MSDNYAESHDFSELCDKLIRDHPGNREIENAVIELEVAHKSGVNAVKRGFNARLDVIEANAQEEKERLARRAAEDAQFHTSELASVTADYERQLAQASENYKRDLERIKATYNSLIEDNTRRTAVVSQLHADHAKELKRVKDESDRIVGNKEKEIARLNRKLDDEALVAREAMADAEEHCRLLEDDGAVLRSKLLESEVAREKAAMQHQEETRKLMEQQENIIHASTSLLNQFQNKSADLELELSKVRALMFDQAYQAFRAKLRAEAFKNGSTSMTKEMEELDARKEQERAALAEVLSRATKANEDQEETLRQFQKDLNEEMERLREAQRQKEEKGDNLVVKLPSGATVDFKTRVVPKKPGSNSKLNSPVLSAKHE